MEGQLIHGDSDHLLAQMAAEKKTFDLILTDPPYNIGKDFGNSSDRLQLDDFLAVSRKRIELCRDLLNPTGSLVWFGIHNFIGFLQTIMHETGLYYRRMNIWYYENGFSRATRSPLTQYEPFLWFSKSDKKWNYNTDDVRVPYKSRDRLKNPVYYTTSKGEKRAWLPNPKGAMRGDVWRFPTLAGGLFKKEKTGHPAQKPECLVIELIKAFCPKNAQGFYAGTVLDPFHGSGTVGVCCERLNRQGHHIRWIGIEVEEKWHDTAQKRLAEII